MPFLRNIGGLCQKRDSNASDLRMSTRPRLFNGTSIITDTIFLSRAKPRAEQKSRGGSTCIALNVALT